MEAARLIQSMERKYTDACGSRNLVCRSVLGVYAPGQIFDHTSKIAA